MERGVAKEDRAGGEDKSLNYRRVWRPTPKPIPWKLEEILAVASVVSGGMIFFSCLGGVALSELALGRRAQWMADAVAGVMVLFAVAAILAGMRAVMVRQKPRKGWVMVMAMMGMLMGGFFLAGLYLVSGMHFNPN